MLDLNEAMKNLLAGMPDLEPEIDDDGTSISAYANRRYGAALTIQITQESGALWLTVESEVPGHPIQHTALIDEPSLRANLLAAATHMATIPEEDAWEPGEYGYTDSNFVGTEEWEDQAGMVALKATLKLDPSWYLMKLVRFDHKKLLEIEQWLADNCMAQFKRVGWASGCSTKVAIAFESQHDAIMYSLRWK
jgi:hypothetical protein